MNSTQIDLLKDDIQHACTVLQSSSPESMTYWITITQDIIRKIDANETNIPLVKKELEELFTLLLLRVTTNLQSVRFFGIYPTTRELLKRMISMNLSEIICRGISEFLLTSEHRSLEEEREKELESMKLQVNLLQKELAQYRSKEYQDQITQTSPILTSQDIIREYDTSDVYEQAYSMENIKMEEEFMKKEEEDFTIRINISNFNIESEANRSDINDYIPLRTWDCKSLHSPKSCCLCILDLEGNFIMMDKQAQKIFGVKEGKLLTTNFFNLMIPFSLHHLKKSMGETIFSSLDTQEKVFSYTVYSDSAFKRYRRIMKKMRKTGEFERKKIAERKYDADEKMLCSDDKSVYYKYLQTLTSRATLVNFQFNKIEDLLKLQAYEDVKFNLEHRIFTEEDDFMLSCPTVLLVTRKSFHIQNFQYSLMEKFDDKIIQMEEQFGQNLVKTKRKIWKSDEQHGI